MSNDKFEEVGSTRTIKYDPTKDNLEPVIVSAPIGRANHDFSDLLDETTHGNPTILGAPVVAELNAWANVINALKDGLPIPYNPAITIQKIRRLERETGEDLTVLKNLPAPSNEVREAQYFKPTIFAIIDRIQEIGNLKVEVR